MQLEFSYSFDDYREANAAVLRSQRAAWLRWLAWTVTAVLVSLSALVFFTLIVAGRGEGQDLWTVLKRHALFVAVAVYLAYSALTSRRRQIRRAWRAQPMLQLRQRVEIDDAKLTMDDAQSRVEYKWNAFTRFVETANVFVLLPTEVSLVIIPKRAFVDDASVGAFRQILETRVARPAPGFPVIPTGGRDV